MKFRLIQAIKIWPYRRGKVKFHDCSELSEILTDIIQYHKCTSKQLYCIPECRCSFKKIETSISTCNIDNGKMNIAGVSGRINGAKLLRVEQVGISECGRWLYYDGVTALTGCSYKKMNRFSTSTKKVTNGDVLLYTESIFFFIFQDFCL